MVYEFGKYAQGPQYELWFASTIYELRYDSPPLYRIDIENFASNALLCYMS